MKTALEAHRNRSLTRRGSLFALAGLVSASCSDAPASSGGSSATSAPALPPADKPRAMRGALVLGDARRVHDLLKTRYGFRALLPGATWEASVVVLAGLSISCAETVDGSGVVRGALVKNGAGAMDLVLGVPLRAPDRLLALNAAGKDASFRVRRDDAARIDWLEPVVVDVPVRRAVGVSKNHLVLGGSAESVALVAAYLAEASALDFASPSSGLTAKLEADAIAALTKNLSSRVAAVSGPDWSALRALLSTEEDLVRASDASRAEITGELGDDALQVTVSLTVPGPAPAGGCVEGSREELLRSNADATVAAATFSTEVARTQSATRAASWLEQSGLAAGDRAVSAKAALESIAVARGSATRMAVERSEIGWIAYGSSELSNREAAGQALDALADVFEAPSEPSTEASGGLALASSKTVFERIGEVTRLRVQKRADKGAEPETLTTIALRKEGDRLALATGPDVGYALEKALGGDDAAVLGDDASIRKLAELIDEKATMFAYVDVVGLERGRGSEVGAAIASLRPCSDVWSLRLALQPAAVDSAARFVTARGRP